MRISVIVPLYNTRAYVAEALDSILAQSRPADEVVVVDDGSTDGGGQVVATYHPRVRLLAHDHAGPAAALNLGLQEIGGDAVAFLDADDIWTPDKLARQVAVLAGDPALDAVLGHVQQFTAPAHWTDAASLRKPQPGVSRNTLLARRSVFDRFGRFDASLRITDFVPWYAQAVLLGMQTLMLPQVLAYRRLHGANTGIVRRGEQQQENLLGLKRALDLRRSRSPA